MDDEEIELINLKILTMNKKCLTLLIGCLAYGIALFSQGEVTIPSKSPRAAVTQTIGLAEVSIHYGRPAVKNRDIYNDRSVIPGMQMGSWTAGAGHCTQLRLSKAVKIEGKELPAGDYCLFMDINGEAVQLNINPEHWQEAAFSYDAAKNVLEIPIKLQASPILTEWLQYTFENLTNDAATVVMRWGDKQVAFTIQSHLEQDILESFTKEMKTKTWFTWRGPYSAAKYAYEQDMHLQASLGWINTADSWNPGSFQILKLKSNILRKLHQNTEAEKTMQLAMEKGNPFELTQEGMHLVYIEKRPEDGYKFLKLATEKAPDYHIAWSTLASYYSAIKDKKNAIKYLKKALEVGDKTKSWGPGEREQLAAGLERLKAMGNG